MAVITYKAIHSTPKEHLKYILNPDKSEDLKYVTGICCNEELELAHVDFKQLFELYSEEKIDNRRINKDGKEHVRIHSYIQSFEAGVSPEEAHRIGVEWCKEMFGEERPVIITTHTNTDHAHNHIAVCPYDIHGKMWHSNKKSLKLARTVSDRICLEHGLSVIENLKRRSDISYAEWLTVRNNRS